MCSVMDISMPLVCIEGTLNLVDLVQVARLFGPAIFESSKLKVLFLGVDEKKHPSTLPRTYTLTHSDITAKLTLAISHSINNSQVKILLSALNISTYT